MGPSPTEQEGQKKDLESPSPSRPSLLRRRWNHIMQPGSEAIINKPRANLHENRHSLRLVHELAEELQVRGKVSLTPRQLMFVFTPESHHVYPQVSDVLNSIKNPPCKSQGNITILHSSSKGKSRLTPDIRIRTSHPSNPVLCPPPPQPQEDRQRTSPLPRVQPQSTISADSSHNKRRHDHTNHTNKRSPLHPRPGRSSSRRRGRGAPSGGPRPSPSPSSSPSSSPRASQRRRRGRSRSRSRRQRRRRVRRRRIQNQHTPKHIRRRHRRRRIGRQALVVVDPLACDGVDGPEHAVLAVGARVLRAVEDDGVRVVDGDAEDGVLRLESARSHGRGGGGVFTFRAPAAVGMKPEKKPPREAGTQPWVKWPATTLWLRAQKRNSMMSPMAAVVVLGSKVRPSRPTETGLIAALA